MSVSVWEEKVIIPTYEVGEPNKNPMFFEKRIYQGSSGVVYPNPVIEKIFDEKVDKEYIGLFLENDFIKMMVLPELGGRIQMAFDKIKNRHFVYYNQVIKPALVGLTGPWVSGGIEFNWPQHHRPSTFNAIDYKIEENSDGSKTIWVNEVEQMFHTKGMAGFTLYPDKAYIEVKAKILNRTNLPQTFLWWANPAVKVNDHYQSVFPTDVNAVFDHGKRDVSDFPIATGTYYKVDYSPGTDISMYKNIPVPTSYMAINSNYDFVGGYENDSESGLLHVANHHISPGKKQWTWGHGDFGLAWDRNLTDEDGPYIELMTGVFTDNQPDFTWLMPNEEKTFTQYFLPYRELGMVRNASKDILVSVSKMNDGLLSIKVFGTSAQSDLQLELSLFDHIIFKDLIAISPEHVYTKEIEIGDDFLEKDVILVVRSPDGKELLKYEPSKNKSDEIPESAKQALDPQEITSIEQLFLTGQHLEQYRHATYSPVPYYEEALRREPGDLRCNNALGLWYLRRGQFKKSEAFFRKAIETMTARNPNPYEGEPYYNLGLCLKYQGRQDEAYDAFYKAVWSHAWKHSAYFNLAQIDVQRSDYELALQHIEIAIDNNANNSKAYVLKSAAYRKLGRLADAIETTNHALKRDGFNLSALFERIIILKAQEKHVEANEDIKALIKLSRSNDQSFLGYSLDYAQLGLFSEAIELLSHLIKGNNPLVFYYLGYFSHQLGNHQQAFNYLEKTESADPYLCFPNRLEEINILKFALNINPADPKAPYYLGNLFYDKRQYEEAIELWELSSKLDDTFPTVLRNLGIASFNKLDDVEQSLQYFEKAFDLDPTDDRICMELNQLYKRLNVSPEQRLVFLEKYWDTAKQRDDVYLEMVEIQAFLGNYKEALDLIMSRKFHPWEGGEGKVSGLYVTCLVQLARIEIEKEAYQEAINLLEKAQVYPHSLGEGKLYNAQENDVFYWLGCAYNGLNEKKESEICYLKASRGMDEPQAALFYNDAQPDKIFYQGLAWRNLGNVEKSNRVFKKLIDFGALHLHNSIKMDYFAVSLPNLLVFDDDLDLRNKIHCHFIRGLGYLGLEQYSQANDEFLKVLSLESGHLSAKIHLEMGSQTIECFLKK